MSAVSVVRVRPDLVHLRYDNFTVSFMRDCDFLEVALIMTIDGEEVIEVIDCLRADRADGGAAIKLYGGWVNQNLGGLNTTDLGGKISILLQLCESFEYSFPTYIKLKKEV